MSICVASITAGCRAGPGLPLDRELHSIWETFTEKDRSKLAPEVTTVSTTGLLLSRPMSMYTGIHNSCIIDFTIGFTITEKAPTRAFYWLKAATTIAFTFKTLL